MTSATIREWESAEIERSIIEAEQTPEAVLRLNEPNVRRYLRPRSDTPFPLEYAFHLLGNVAGKMVLDYGCGSGENCVPLARLGASLIGVDVSAALLRLAQLRMQLNGVGGRSTFITASAHNVPLPDASVDVLLGVAILHHLDLDIAAQEVWRLLKPGGRAIFQEPVRNSKLLRIARAMIPYAQKDVSPYERPLTDRELWRFAERFSRGRTRVFSLPLVNVAKVIPPLRRYVPALYRTDAAILRATPALQTFATIRVFELIKR